MKLYVTVTPSGSWRVEVAVTGRMLYSGTIGNHVIYQGHDYIPAKLPAPIETAVRRAWISKKVVTVPYTPETAPRLG